MLASFHKDVDIMVVTYDQQWNFPYEIRFYFKPLAKITLELFEVKAWILYVFNRLGFQIDEGDIVTPITSEYFAINFRNISFEQFQELFFHLNIEATKLEWNVQIDVNLYLDEYNQIQKRYPER